MVAGSTRRAFDDPAAGAGPGNRVIARIVLLSAAGLAFACRAGEANDYAQREGECLSSGAQAGADRLERR